MPTLGLLANPEHLGAATDLYQLTMAAGYLENGLGEETATFELFVRRLPPNRNYLVCAGLHQALEYLLGLRFGEAEIRYLRAQPAFAGIGEGFWAYLRDFRFTGEVCAVPEGTVFFPQEPMLQVTAPLIQAQMVETFLLATLNHQTLIASKAARVVEAAGARTVVEFGARRAHGFDAALYGARAAVIGGCVGTSNVLAGQIFGIPIYGTAAHSFIMAFPREEDAFAAFHRAFPRHSILLIDTYDSIEGARKAAALSPPVRGVRLDSGDLADLSRKVRRILDDAGLGESIIVASGDLHEGSIAELVADGAPIDVFGVGTELMTSRDAPALGGVYKLVAVQEAAGWRPVRKLSPGKETYPGAKQVWRRRSPQGTLLSDVLSLAHEVVPHAEPLLRPVMRNGVLLEESPGLDELRERAREQRLALPAEVRSLTQAAKYPLELSPGLRSLMD